MRNGQQWLGKRTSSADKEAAGKEKASRGTYMTSLSVGGADGHREREYFILVQVRQRFVFEPSKHCSPGVRFTLLNPLGTPPTPSSCACDHPLVYGLTQWVVIHYRTIRPLGQ